MQNEESQISKYCVSLLADRVSNEIAKNVIRDCIAEEPTMYYIGFYKKCRSVGVYLHTNAGV